MWVAAHSRRRAVATWLVLMVSISIAALSAKCFTWASTWDRRFERWLVAEPVRLTADFSRPGEYRAALRQTCAVAHAEVFELDGDLSAGPPDLAGVRALLTIMDQKGHQVATAIFPPEFELLEPDRGNPVLFRVVPFREGTYEAVLHVQQGGEALRGRMLDVVARYELCGLERMPATVSRWAGALAALVACVVATIGLTNLAPPAGASARCDTLGR